MTRCPLCESAVLRPFLELPPVPVHNGVLWPTRAEARACERGRIALGHCPACGFISNTAFDPGETDYTGAYDNALHHSAVFRGFERELAERLVAAHGVRDRDVVEIGCGDGHFLQLIADVGGNRGIGFDPTSAPALEGTVRIMADHYDERAAAHPADLVVCRHVLEHIPAPRPFMTTLRRSLADRPEAIVYLEVPNALFYLRDLSVWDLVYEHCSNYVPAALERLFELSGFEVLDVREPYEGQFLSIEARPAAVAPTVAPGARSGELEAVAADVAAMGRRFEGRTTAWRARLDDLAADGRRIVAWGGGAKAVGFFNLLGVEDEVAVIADVNPAKHGLHLPGTGHEIVAPEALRELAPDVVIVMNPLYAQEIRADLVDLGLTPEVIPL